MKNNIYYIKITILMGVVNLSSSGCFSCGGCCSGGATAGVRPILSDSICGDFELACGSTSDPSRFVWRSRITGTTIMPVAGTVTVLYTGGCSVQGNPNPLVVNIRSGGDAGTIVGSLSIPGKSGQTQNAQSITLQQFDTVEILCAAGTGGGACTGTFCLNIHYPSPFSLT
jgi:hypothetical protein